MVEDVYEVCPIYKKEYIALKQTTMEIVNENFYELFQLEAIITKAVQADTERINLLILNGYKSISREFMIYDDYYVKIK